MQRKIPEIKLKLVGFGHKKGASFVMPLSVLVYNFGKVVKG
jgi:hypothetical protein